jgi:predicted N-acetyltransferase YhbS
VQLKPFTAADLRALGALARRAAPGLAYMDAAGWRAETLADKATAARLRLKAVEGDRLLGVAVGAMHGPPKARQGFVKLALVKPTARRRGVGAALFGALESRFKALGAGRARVGECPPPYVAGGVDALDTAAHCFLLQRGYERCGTVIDMTADLRRFKAAYSPADRALMAQAGLRRAGRPERAALMALLKREFPWWVTEVSLALERGSVHVAGSGAAIEAFACGGGTHPGWFGPMGTAKAGRGRGLGRLLMWRCLEGLRDQGHASCRIPWVGPIPFYSRFAGARLSHLHWSFAKDL